MQQIPSVSEVKKRMNKIMRTDREKRIASETLNKVNQFPSICRTPIGLFCDVCRHSANRNSLVHHGISRRFFCGKMKVHFYNAEDLRAYIVRFFVKLHVPEEDARMAADVLISADLRGVDSHGIIRLSTYYGG